MYDMARGVSAALLLEGSCQDCIFICTTRRPKHNFLFTELMEEFSGTRADIV